MTTQIAFTQNDKRKVVNFLMYFEMYLRHYDDSKFKQWLENYKFNIKTNLPLILHWEDTAKDWHKHVHSLVTYGKHVYSLVPCEFHETTLHYLWTQGGHQIFNQEHIEKAIRFGSLHLPLFLLNQGVVISAESLQSCFETYNICAPPKKWELNIIDIFTHHTIKLIINKGHLQSLRKELSSETFRKITIPFVNAVMMLKAIELNQDCKSEIIMWMLE